MAGITSTLIASITAVDPNAAQPITRNVGNPSLPGQFGDFTTYRLLAAANADVDITIDATPNYCIYIKNLNAPGGGRLTVKGTPQGAAQITLGTVEAGGVFIVWSPTSNVASGYTRLTLNPSAGNTPVEYYLGG